MAVMNARCVLLESNQTKMCLFYPGRLYIGCARGRVAVQFQGENRSFLVQGLFFGTGRGKGNVWTLHDATGSSMRIPDSSMITVVMSVKAEYLKIQYSTCLGNGGQYMDCVKKLVQENFNNI